MLGSEEIKKIDPIIKELNNKRKNFEGPFSADAFFGAKEFKNYDGVFSWYHDQGLVGFKSFSFEDGVNYTGGLPIVRTSPDHGTAFNVSGKGIANENSLIESIKLNIRIINQRMFSK
jgi:4-hydroxythreonine-4-phosphate dehydrogenase